MVNNQLDMPKPPADASETDLIAQKLEEQEPVSFGSQFEGYMEMYSDAQTVAQYLDAHDGWFKRCAQPMGVEPLGDSGYTLTVGRFGAFGYEVEPKISIELHSPQERVYAMHAIPNSSQKTGYDIDYQAHLELLEIPLEAATSKPKAARQTELPKTITKVRWQLHLGVVVQFPKFIYKLPLSLIQTTGDRLLSQIVRQISPRLTEKVQTDFHTRLNLPIPPKSSRFIQRVT